MKSIINAEAEAVLEPIGGNHNACDNPMLAASFVREHYQLCFDIADMPQARSLVPRYKHHGVRCTS